MCGSSQPTTPDKTTQVAELPEWARGYAKDALAKGSALTDINQNPYQQYGGERIAGFSPMQQQAFQGAANMQPSQQLGFGSDLAGAAGIGALSTNYQGRNFRGGQFDNQAAEQYMNPYTQNVIDYQKSQALRDFQIAQPMRQAQAVQQGAFGGSRSAIVDAEAQRSLNSQLQGITATGQQAAFQNAQQQFNADQARRLQAQQMGEQSRQYGAGLGMQGLQTGLQAAGQLGQLGQTQYGQQLGINQLQSQYGQQQQQQAQRPLDMAYQDFQNQQNYPYKQLGFMSDLIRGLPLGQQSTQTMYQAPGSTLGQLAGLGLGAYGVSRMAEGGSVHDYAEGGDVTSDQNVENIMSKLSDQQLQQAKEAALSRQDVEQANMIDSEIAMRASARNGIGAGITPQFADQMEEGMASGGIVAFADRGAVKDEEETSPFYELLAKFGRAINPAASGSQKELESKQAVMDKARELRNEEPGFFSVMKPSERKAKVENIEQRRKALSEVVEKVSSGDYSAVDVLKAKPESNKYKNKLSNEEIEARWNAVQKEGRDSAPKVTADTPPQQPLAQKTKNLQPGSKPSVDQVTSAAAQFADQSGVAKGEKDDYMATVLKLRDELGKQDQPSIDRLNAAIEAQKPDERSIRDKGISQALAQFGFGMAERAARPGAKFLESASGAAPVLASVAEKTNALIEAKKENYAKMQLDQAKYELALSQGKMQTAATLAGNINQAKQADRLLDFHIAKSKQEFSLKQEELGIKREELRNTRNYQGQMASRYETIGSLTRDIMKNQGLPYDKAFAQAAHAMRGGIGADIRADAGRSIQLQKDIDKIDETFYPIILATKDPTKLAALYAKRDSLVQKKRQEANMGDASTSGSPPPSLTQKGFKYLGKE